MIMYTAGVWRRHTGTTVWGCSEQ